MAVYKAKTKIDSSNNLEDVKFPMSAIDGLSEALASGGGGITELSDQYVRVWNLSTGIYKLTYKGAQYIYYYGATSTASVSIKSGSGDVLLFVSQYTTTYKTWIAFSTGRYAFNAGYTSSSSGSYTNRDLTYIPQASVVNNLTSTSTTAPLSAKQGNVLKGLIDDLTETVDNISAGDTPIATTTTVGGIKAQSGSSSGQSFPVQVNTDGTAFINIPIYTGGTV